MWRSLLFIPVLEDRFIAKAAERGADAIILDLEASVADAQKAEARLKLPEVVKRLAPKTVVTVRINPLWLEAVRDLEACVIEHVRCLHLARCEGPDEVAAIANLVSEFEAERGLEPGAISLIPMLESPGAVLRALAMAQASQRVRALTIGVEDYATAMGVAASDQLLRPAGHQVIQAARAANIDALVVPASIADFRNDALLREAASYARALGATGGYAVHPKQVAVLNQVFAPTQEEITWAQSVIAAHEQAPHLAVFKVNEQMIDKPLLERAQAIQRRVASG